MEVSFFDIILIILAVVVIMHLLYHASQLSVEYKQMPYNQYKNMQEHMGNINMKNMKYSNDYNYDNSSSYSSSFASQCVPKDNKSPDGADGKDKGFRITTIGNDYDGNVKFPELKRYNETPTTTPQKDIDRQKEKQNEEEALNSLNALKQLQDLRAFKTKEDLTIDQNAENVKRYIRDYVLDGLNKCNCVTNMNQPDFTPQEIDAYREKHIEFRENTWGTSKGIDGIDPVDKINQINYNGGVPANGMTIANYYDNLTSAKVADTPPGFVMGTNIPKTKCVAQPQMENTVGPVGYYTGMGNAKYFKRDNWEYQNENPINGGLYYDDISGSDPMMDYQMINN